MSESFKSGAIESGAPDTVSGPAGRIAFRRAGRGPTLVLLHPLALSGEAWGPFATELTAYFDVIAPDARGHGESGWDRRPFAITDLAGDVGALLDGLELDAVHLLGMSMGGSTAIEFAAATPERVRRLLLADTTAWYGADAVQTWDERAERAAAVPREQQLPFQVDRWFTEGFRQARPDEVDRVSGIFARTDSAVHAEASRAMGRLDARPRLGAITAPTLVVAGEEDYATPPTMGRVLAERAANGRFQALTALRHLSLIEDPHLADLATAHIMDQLPSSAVSP